MTEYKKLTYERTCRNLYTKIRRVSDHSKKIGEKVESKRTDRITFKLGIDSHGQIKDIPSITSSLNTDKSIKNHVNYYWKQQ